MLELAAGKGKTAGDSRQMVGLAAVQLGVNMRIITVDMAADGFVQEQQQQVLINPRIVSSSEETEPGREGCWSCGDICGNVERAQRVTVDALDRKAKPLTLVASNFIARIIQHEVDHLDGIRFPDRIPESEPRRLHLVKPDQFENYRKEWQNWPILCPREQWFAMRDGDRG